MPLFLHSSKAFFARPTTSKTILKAADSPNRLSTKAVIFSFFKMTTMGTTSKKTMEAKKVPGLYAIGEAVDVTGWLGGYNVQWAWSSGWVAGEAV